MQIIFHCDRCRKDTHHHIGNSAHITAENKQVSELKCIACIGNPIYVEHEPNRLPNYNSKLTVMPIKKEDEHGSDEE